jgi:hypothetical protein
MSDDPQRNRPPRPSEERVRALDTVAGKAEQLVQRWSEASPEGVRYLLKELGASLQELERVEVATGEWEAAHA